VRLSRDVSGALAAGLALIACARLVVAR
jgi:hypothetical protein